MRVVLFLLIVLNFPTANVDQVKIVIPISESLRVDKTPFDLWRNDDHGLIHAWELGRRQGTKSSILAEKATRGELPASNLFRGGYEERLTAPFQYGSLHYYCLWMGWKGVDLEVYTEREYPLVCTKTHMGVVYTLDSYKYLSSAMSKTHAEQYGLDFVAKVIGVPNGTQATSLR